MKDAYVHLGIPPSATIEEIEAAYATKKRLFDPLRFAEGSSEWEEARKMSTTIELAYHFAVASYYAPVKKETPVVTFPPPPSVVPSYTKPRKKRISPALVTVLGTVGVLAGIAVLYASMSRSPAPRETKVPVAAVHPSMVQAPPAPQQPDQTELADMLLRTTVLVRVDAGEKTGTGSGFFINQKGDILTNYHVVDGVGRILVTFYDGGKSWAKIRGVDKDRDMALLALDSPPRDVPLLPRSLTRPKQGESILVAGAPRGYDNTLSNGIVAAVRDMDSSTFVQITAPISPGSSGGPVMNMKGEIIAMSTKFRVDAQNLNFAVASVIFNDFIAYAERQTPLPFAAAKTPARVAPDRSRKRYIRVKEDSSYTTYIDPKSVHPLDDSTYVVCTTIWSPSPATKAEVARTFNLTKMDLGDFVLIYAADLTASTIVHLYTANLYVDGTIAREYERPEAELKIETPEPGTRADAILKALQKNFPKLAKRSASKNDGSGISLPTEAGFMGHKWGCSIQEIKKRLPDLHPLNQQKTPGTYTTGKSFAAFEIKTDVIVVYEFFKNRLYQVVFLQADRSSGGNRMQPLYDELTDLYGFEGEEVEVQNAEDEFYAWRTGDLMTLLKYISKDDYFCVEFLHVPTAREKISTQ